MQFWEHLEELRWSILKILLILIIFTVLSLAFADDIIKLFLYPIELIKQTNPEIVIKTTLTGPFDGVLIKLKVGFLAGLIISYPFILYFIWEFIRPGLKENEKKAFNIFCIFGTISFLLGVILGYFLLIPVLKVLISYSIKGSINLWTIKSFINFVFYWVLGAGFIFELPFILVVLSKIGIITVLQLRKVRPFFYIFAFVLAAIITPPDPFTMIIVGIPMILLFELGILLSKVRIFKKEKVIDE